MAKSIVLQRPIHGIVVSNVDLIARSVGGAFDSYSVANSDGNKISKEEKRATQLVVIVRKAVTDRLLHVWVDWANENDIPVIYAERKAAVLQEMQDKYDILDKPSPEKKEAPTHKAEEAREVVHVAAPDDDDDPMTAALTAVTNSYERKLVKARKDKDDAETMALELSEQVSELQKRLDEQTSSDKHSRAEDSVINERVQGRVDLVLEEKVAEKTKELKDQVRKQSKALTDKETELKKLRVEVKDLRGDLKDRAAKVLELEEKLNNISFNRGDLNRVLGATMVAHAVCFSDDEDLRSAFDQAVESARNDPNFGKALTESLKSHSMVRDDTRKKKSHFPRAVSVEENEHLLFRPSPKDDPEFQRITT